MKIWVKPTPPPPPPDARGAILTGGDSGRGVTTVIHACPENAGHWRATRLDANMEAFGHTVYERGGIIGAVEGEMRWGLEFVEWRTS